MGLIVKMSNSYSYCESHHVLIYVKFINQCLAPDKFRAIVCDTGGQSWDPWVSFTKKQILALFDKELSGS